MQLFPAPFAPVAIQWLSTYQFAVVFVEEKADAVQCKPFYIELIFDIFCGEINLENLTTVRFMFQHYLL